MRYIIFLGDGVSDWPLRGRGNRTPLMIADTPAMDFLTRKGRTGQLETIPKSMPADSEVANMGILGYDQQRFHQGRGVLEAAAMGVDIKRGEVAMRCNLLCIENGNLKNYHAGHINAQNAKELINYLDEKLGNEDIKFHFGFDYRHVLVLRNASTDIELAHPHDVQGTKIDAIMPKETSKNGKRTRSLIDSLIRKSWEILLEHPVNRKRKKNGKDPANSIWPWSPGYKPEMPTFAERFGIKGAVISAVNLIKGLGVYAGLDIILVDGITGLHTTNYEGKADACLKALKDHDFVYVHVEASDEASHDGDTDLKIDTIEYFDQRLIQRVLDNLEKVDDEVTIAVLPDHPTPVEHKAHVAEVVPFLIYNSKLIPDSVEKFDEESVINGHYGLLKGDEFIRTFLENR